MPYADRKKQLAYFREYSKQHRNPQRSKDQRAMTQSAMAMLKLESGCVDCGYNKYPEALQFDHISGTKKMNVASYVAIGPALKEAEKCVVRCANCHAIRTVLAASKW